MRATTDPMPDEMPADPRWRAVAERDATQRDAYVYAVRTTGVYCRPGCSSRRPRRHNVSFFDSPEQARAAGFRACARCHPDGRAAGEVAAERLARVVARACELIEAADGVPTLDELAAAAGCSPSHLHRQFKAAVGLTPRQYATTLRRQRARQQLADGASVTEAVYASGYGTSSRFYAEAGEMLGMRPADYGRGGAGQSLQVAVTRSELGWVLVAATGRGVCAVELGDSEDEVRERLAARLPHAEITSAAGEMAARLLQVVARLDSQQTSTPVALDIRGTAFQRRVWEELQRIPRGETATYGEVAARIGRPGAARAVAQACAANPTAVVIPCHRVVRRGGEPGGYRWGEERKRALLEGEVSPG